MQPKMTIASEDFYSELWFCFLKCGSEQPMNLLFVVSLQTDWGCFLLPKMIK